MPNAPPRFIAAQTAGERQGVVFEGSDEVRETVRGVLADVLGLSRTRVDAFTDETPLFGALPELDSMAVAGVLTELEDRLAIVIEDDEVDGELLDTFGSLVAFAVRKAIG